MGRSILMIAASLGVLAMLLGTFGAHGIEDWTRALPDGAKRLAWWKTGTDYVMYAALLLAAVGALAVHHESRAAWVSTVAAVIGCVLFSGALFGLTLTDMRWLGAVAPLGGTSFIVAWGALFVAARSLVVDK